MICQSGPRKVSGPPNFEGDMTKFAPQKAKEPITWNHVGF